MTGDTRYLRHEDHLPEKLRKVGLNFIGVGSVGSFAAYPLIKMGFTNVQVFDPDVLERHNISNQNYPIRAVGMNKALAFQERIRNDEGISIQVTPKSYTGQNLRAGIVISAVDSMDARREIWGHLKKNPDVELYIDSRMGLEQAQIFTVHPKLSKEVEWYETHLVGDGKEAVCTAKVTMYTVNATAWCIGSIVSRYVREDAPIPPRLIVDSVNLEVIQPKPKED